jgi:hypothetical protein
VTITQHRFQFRKNPLTSSQKPPFSVTATHITSTHFFFAFRVSPTTMPLSLKQAFQALRFMSDPHMFDLEIANKLQGPAAERDVRLLSEFIFSVPPIGDGYRTIEFWKKRIYIQACAAMACQEFPDNVFLCNTFRHILGETETADHRTTSLGIDLEQWMEEAQRNCKAFLDHFSSAYKMNPALFEERCGHWERHMICFALVLEKIRVSVIGAILLFSCLVDQSRTLAYMCACLVALRSLNSFFKLD